MTEIKKQMRDGFFEKLYELAKEDNNIIILSPDMTGQNLLKFKKNLSGQYINTRAAEQNSLLVAAGLALNGKKPYLYSITPFVTTRIHEFIKIEMGLMKIPITIVGVGCGCSYEDAGPTHFALEDLGMMRSIPNLEIYSPSDNNMASYFAKQTYNSKAPSYIRLDRQVVPDIYSPNEKFEEGFRELKSGRDVLFIATGNMVHVALNVCDQISRFGKSCGVIDLYKIKPVNAGIIKYLSNYKVIFSLEENFLSGGLGSMISEIISDNDIQVKLIRIGIKDCYNYEYGGRENLHKKFEIDPDTILKKFEELNR